MDTSMDITDMINTDQNISTDNIYQTYNLSPFNPSTNTIITQEYTLNQENIQPHEDIVEYEDENLTSRILEELIDELNRNNEMETTIPLLNDPTIPLLNDPTTPLLNDSTTPLLNAPTTPNQRTNRYDLPTLTLTSYSLLINVESDDEETV